jgi:hypothetical protein
MDNIQTFDSFEQMVIFVSASSDILSQSFIPQSTLCNRRSWNAAIKWLDRLSAFNFKVHYLNTASFMYKRRIISVFM